MLLLISFLLRQFKTILLWSNILGDVGVRRSRRSSVNWDILRLQNLLELLLNPLHSDSRKKRSNESGVNGGILRNLDWDH